MTEEQRTKLYELADQWTAADQAYTAEAAKYVAPLRNGAYDIPERALDH